MMPSIINNPQAGASGAVPKLAEEADVPLPALCALAWARGLSKLASQSVAGPNLKPNLVHTENLCKPRVLEKVELAAERAVADYGSSGSDHDPSSVSLFAMVHDFIENDGAGEQTGCASDRLACLTTNTRNFKVHGAVDVPQDVQSLTLCKDGAEEMLLRDTQRILSTLIVEERIMCEDGEVATTAHRCLKRAVMSKLQKMGYVAAVCKTKWDQLCGIPAGDYEYIDVLGKNGSKIPERLIVDIDFQGQFEIARPTDEFSAMCRLLPHIFVGTGERLKKIIHVMSEAIKQSLRVRGLHLPPWRKLAYMKAKWFSSYKRTTNVSLGRPCREKGQHCNGLGLAVRGGGLDARYTATLEMLYHDAGPRFWNGGRDVNMCERERDEITVVATDWQPPAIVPRCAAPRKQGIVMGLTSLLSHAPTLTCSDALV